MSIPQPITNIECRNALHQTATGLPALDFFAGSGLATEGLQPYFDVIWANDICEKKAATYKANHPPETFHLGRIEDVHGNDLPPVSLSWASFPCQDVSLAGNLEGIESSRSGLVWQWLRVIDEMPLKPPIVVAENVVGLLTAAKGQYYLAVHRALRDRGYRVGAVVLDAIHWLPQSRPRVFIVGAANRNTEHFEALRPLWCHPAAVRQVAVIAEDFVWWSLPKPSARRMSLEDLIDYDAKTHSPQQTQHNLELIPQPHRERMKAMINSTKAVFPGYKRTRNGEQVLELRFDSVAGCLRTPRGGSSRQYLVIYNNGTYETRLLTVKEAARLMGAPASYKIMGTYNDGYKAMGDAVAVPAVRYLARHLLAPLAQGWCHIEQARQIT